MDAAKVYSLSENGSSPHVKEKQVEQSSFKGTCTKTGRCEQSCYQMSLSNLFWEKHFFYGLAII